MKNKAVNRLIALGTTLTILLCGCGGTEKPAVGSAPDRETQTAASQSAAAGENAATGETPVAGENTNEDMITFTFSKSSYPSVTLPDIVQHHIVIRCLSLRQGDARITMWCWTISGTTIRWI